MLLATNANANAITVLPGTRRWVVATPCMFSWLHVLLSAAALTLMPTPTVAVVIVVSLHFIIRSFVVNLQYFFIELIMVAPHSKRPL